LSERTVVLDLFRALGAALLLYAAACSSSTNEPSKSETALILPPGIVPFENATSAVIAGVYPVTHGTCCFLAPKAHVTLDKPAGSLQVTFNFYTPKIGSYYDGETVTVDAGGKSASGALKKGPRRWIVVSMALPPKYRYQTSVPVTITASKTVVPKKIGVNGDTRNLGVILTKVEYP
jgi:hypothetical protein